MCKRRLGWLVALVVCLAWSPAPAEGALEGGPLRKLGRGSANLATGWLELPAQVFRVNEISGLFEAATVGLGRGVVLGIGRTLVGAIELVTFPIPNPTTGYGPVIQPEFVRFRDSDR